MRLTDVFLLLMMSGTLVAQEHARALQINFTASAESFRSATEQYRDIWVSEGPRVVAAMERATGLRFERGPIAAVIYEGPSSSGFHERPMQLRASYSPATKQATLVHELGHRLIGDLVPADFEDHPVIFLFVYDVWVELWGQLLADEQVMIESKRRGLFDYEGACRTTLALPAGERARRVGQFLRERRQ